MSSKNQRASQNIDLSSLPDFGDPENWKLINNLNFGAPINQQQTPSTSKRSSNNKSKNNTSLLDIMGPSTNNRDPLPTGSINNGKTYTRNHIFNPVSGLGVHSLDLLAQRSKYFLYKKETEQKTRKKGGGTYTKPKANVEQRRLLKMFLDLKKYLMAHYEADNIVMKEMTFHVIRKGIPSETITYTQAARTIPMYADLSDDQIIETFTDGKYVSHPHHTLVSLGQNIARMRRLGCWYMGKREDPDPRRDCVNHKDEEENPKNYPFHIKQTQKYIQVTNSGNTVWEQPYKLYTCSEKDVCTWGEPQPKGRVVFIAKRVIDRLSEEFSRRVPNRMKNWKKETPSKGAKHLSKNEFNRIILNTTYPKNTNVNLSRVPKPKSQNLGKFLMGNTSNLSQLSNSERTTDNGPVITIPNTTQVLNLYKSLTNALRKAQVGNIPFEKQDINNFKKTQARKAKFKTPAKKTQLDNLVALRKQIRDTVNKSTLKNVLKSRGFDNADFSSRQTFMKKVGSKNALPNATALKQIFEDLQTLNNKKN